LVKGERYKEPVALGAINENRAGNRRDVKLEGDDVKTERSIRRSGQPLGRRIVNAEFDRT